MCVQTGVIDRLASVNWSKCRIPLDDSPGVMGRGTRHSAIRVERRAWQARRIRWSVRVGFGTPARQWCKLKQYHRYAELTPALRRRWTLAVRDDTHFLALSPRQPRIMNYNQNGTIKQYAR